MKKTILILYMMAMTTLSFSENLFSGTYHYDLDNATCYMEFFKSGCYCLSIEDRVEGSDVILMIVLSYGQFTVKDEHIFLTDEAHDFKMQLQLSMSDNNITAIKGFGFLKDKVFVHWINHYEKSCLESNVNVISQEQEREAYQQAHKTLYSLDYGTYESPNNTFQEDKVYLTHLAYELELEEDNKYSFYYKGICISVGKWSRDRNVLSLLDECLQHTFYALITDNGLVSKYLPGDYMWGGTPLYKVSPVSEQDLLEDQTTYKSNKLKAWILPICGFIFSCIAIWVIRRLCNCNRR